MQTATINPAVAGGFIGGVLGVSVVFAIVFYVLVVIADWKIFKKAGQPGWKSLIPIYNIYIMYKIVKMSKWFWITFCAGIIVSIVNSVLNPSNLSLDMLPASSTTWIILLSIVEVGVALFANILYCIRTSKIFGHGGGYALGLFFLPNLFQLILGFGRSKYNKKLLKEWN